MEEKKRKLSPREDLFCRLYVEIGNAVVAYKKAGYSQNMSYKDLKNEAWKKVHNPDLTPTLEKYQKEWNDRHCLDKEHIKEKLISKHMSIIDSTIKDLFEVDETTGKTKTIIPTELSVDASIAVKRISRGKDGGVSYELQDKVESSKELARLIGLYEPEKTEVSLSKGTPMKDVDFVI